MEAPASASSPSPGPPSIDHLWSRVDSFLRTRLRPDLYERWFAPLRPISVADGRLQIGAPDRFHRDFVEDNYRAWFEEFVPELLGERVRISFAVDNLPRPTQPSPPALPYASTPASRDVPALEPRDSRPNPRYVFDSFVVGASNRFAFAAAQAVAQKPGQAWNPLFLHGDSGLGKTHLLHAVAAAILESQGGGRVAIVSSERYTNDFVASLSKGVMDDFRRKYRECSALLVDDVQFLAGKDKTAEEFFHTFNELHDHHVQIVLSSDRPPKELKGLDERLCSRFEWGMRVQIEAPEFETRAAILQKKASVESIALPDDVTELLAQHIRSNVRELEGALMRLAAFASLKNGPSPCRWRATSSATSSRRPATARPSRRSRRRWPPSTTSRWRSSPAPPASRRWPCPARWRCTSAASWPRKSSSPSPRSSTRRTTPRSSRRWSGSGSSRRPTPPSPLPS